MNFIGSREKLRRANQKIVCLKRELKKKEKVIDLIAYSLADYIMYYDYDKCRNPEMIKAKAKEKIKYFEKKIEEDK